jgi:uncharacterized damage-inducible protein DinB
MTTDLAVIVLDGAFTGKAWQGPTLSGCLRGVTARQAAKKVARRKSIWEQTLHAAHWKLAILRVFDPATTLDLGRKGQNWPCVPADATEKEWKQDVARLAAVHKALRAAVARMNDNAWMNKPLNHATGKPRSYTYAFYLAGAAAHDAYHTGQIRLLKRLVK